MNAFIPQVPPESPSTLCRVFRVESPRTVFRSVALSLRISFQLLCRPRGKRLHLPDGDGVKALESLALRQAHVDELCVHVLEVGENKELFEAGVIAHVAVLAGVGSAPLAGGPAEEGDIEKIGFAGVSERGLLRGDFLRNKMSLDGVGVEAVVDLGQSAVEVPGERKVTVFLVLQPLKLFD